MASSGVPTTERRDEAQLGRVHDMAVGGRRFVRDFPVAAKDIEPARGRCRDTEHREPIFAGRGAARRGHRAGDREFGEGLGVRQDMRARILEREPLRMVGHRFAAQQPEDDFQRLDHAAPCIVGIDAEHLGILDEKAGPHAERDAAARHMVELGDAVRDHERIMIGQGDHAGSEMQALRRLRGGRDKELGRCDGLEAPRMMLADPKFVESHPVEQLRQFDIVLEPCGDALLQRVIRSEEHAMFKRKRGHYPIL
jgi:hypothetical protein